MLGSIQARHFPKQMYTSDSRIFTVGRVDRRLLQSKSETMMAKQWHGHILFAAPQNCTHLFDIVVQFSSGLKPKVPFLGIENENDFFSHNFISIVFFETENWALKQEKLPDFLFSWLQLESFCDVGRGVRLFWLRHCSVMGCKVGGWHGPRRNGRRPVMRLPP